MYKVLAKVYENRFKLAVSKVIEETQLTYA